MTLNPHLRRAVEQTRQELLQRRKWLIADGDHSRIVLALNRQGIHILDHALRGRVSVEEINDWLDACAELVDIGPDPSRYAAVRARWWSVFRELADGGDMVPPPELVNTVDAARWLGMSKRWVEQKVKEGSLPSVKLGRRRLFRVSDLEAYIRGERGWW